jgi:putative transposase
MIIIDQFTRRIMGFAMHKGDVNGPAVCRMFNEIISGRSLSKGISSDNNPLFTYHQ